MENGKFEQEIIRKYIVNERQDRLLWELNSPKKRNTVFWHFAGTNFFKRECLHPIEYMSGDAMTKYLLELSRAENVYFIGESYIGILSLEEAVMKAQTGEICVIYCGNGLGYYQGEQENGKPPRFLLLAQ
jgi:hypothetical protein